MKQINTQIMEATPGIIASLIEKVKAYIITNLELTKLKLIKAVSAAVSVVVFKILLVILVLILFIVSNIGAGLWLGELLGKSYYGFFALSVFYIILIIVLHLFFQKWIKNIISHSILKKLL